MKKTVRGLKILVISILCSLVMIFLHKITLISAIDITGLSGLAKHFGTDAAAFLWGVAAYCIVSYVYVTIEKDLKGSSLRKSLLFGGLIGGMWLLGMLELDQTLNNVIMGLVDGIMVTAVCILTAKLVIPKAVKSEKPVSMKEKNDNNKKSNNNIIAALLIVTVIFGLYRLGFGLLLGKYFDSTSDYILIPVYSLYMGFMWVKLKDILSGEKTIRKAVRYGVIIWGLPSGMFMYFMVFMFKDMFIGLTLRNIFDVLFMSLAVWLTMLSPRHFPLKSI